MKKASVVATVAPGIYKLDDGSYRVVAHAGNSRVNQRRKEKRFPSSAGMREMKRWQATARAAFERDGLRLQRDTLAADVPRFMRVMKHRLVRPEHREHEVNSWLARFGDRRRHTIEPEDVRQQVIAWEVEGLAASTINHRLSALSQLYAVLDGDRSHNPVAGTKRLREPQPKPDGKSPETIQRVFTALEQRVKAQSRGWPTLARLKVIALTGMRHSQVMRLERDHVYRRRRSLLRQRNSYTRHGIPRECEGRNQNNRRLEQIGSDWRRWD
jgi:integrase